MSVFKLPAKLPAAEAVALTMQAQRVLDYYQAGYRTPEIAEAMGLTRVEVRRALLQISKRDFEHGLLKREHLRAQAAVDLDYLQHELEAAWEDSKPPKDKSIEEQIQEVINGTPEQVKRISIKRNYEHGDARYLQLAADIIAHKRKLLGLDEPKSAAGPRLPDMGNLPEGTSATVTFMQKMMEIKYNVTASAPITDTAAGERRPVEQTPEPEKPAADDPPPQEDA